MAWWSAPLLIAALLALASAARPLRRSTSSWARVPANLALGAVTFGLPSFVPIAALWSLASPYAAVFNVINVSALPLQIALPLSALIWSFAFYLLHRVAHKVPLLWRLHRVHHTDTHVSITTSFRHHPGELLISIFFGQAVALMFGLSAVAIGTYATLSLLFNLWEHANVRLPPKLDAALQLLVVTPRMHLAHHSAEQAETDSNFGDILSIWDHLLGTHVVLSEKRLDGLPIGLGDGYDAKASNMLEQLLLPFRNAARPRSFIK